MDTILYIEDNSDSRLLIRRVLEAENFTVLEAANASQAMIQIENGPPDLILMDINMPEVDGYTLTTRLKSRTDLNHVPIIALTANALRGDRERTLEAGCDGYIQKPVDIDLLSQQITSFLREVNHGQARPHLKPYGAAADEPSTT